MKTLATVLLALGLGVGLTACEEGPLEDAGERADRALDNAGDRAENAAERAADEIDDAADRLN